MDFDEVNKLLGFKSVPVSLDNVDKLAKETQELRKQGKIKIIHVDLGEGPASDYGTGKIAND